MNTIGEETSEKTVHLRQRSRIYNTEMAFRVVNCQDGRRNSFIIVFK